MKSRWVVWLAVAAAFAAATGQVAAHHSFSATYQEGKVVEIRGQIVQFLFRNPHSYVHVMVPDENGEMQRWAVEWGGAGQLGEQGMTRSTLRIGDEVVITGAPSRNTEQRHLRMNTLLRPSDGFSWGGSGEGFN
ncbi:MAG TPA: DUF6152 family protein [Gammaproteobacteria bacterium]